MGFNKDDLAKVKENFRIKNLRAKDAATERLRELEREIPEFYRVERGFAEIGAGVLAVSMDASLSTEERRERLARLENEREALSEERRYLLAEHGYPPNYTAPVFECEKCRDTGFFNSEMCTCMRRELVKMGYESSGLGPLIRTQSFEGFSLDYYEKGEQRDSMSRCLSFCRSYASGFDMNSGNILFLGGTGLGKTHLSTSIAKTVIEKGYYVIYETAQTVLGDHEREYFGKRYERGELTSRYTECDLLVIDDLGTELCTQFTVSALYNLLNTRLNHQRPMIVSSNISDPEQLRGRYTDRIVSRLFGEFRSFVFTGRDVRAQKLE